MRHAGHVLLDDGLQFVFHRLLVGATAYEVVLHQRVGEGIDGAGALTVELEHMAMLDVLVDAVEIVDGPGIFGRGVEHVDAEGEIGFRIMEHAEHGGQDVDLLGNLVLDGGLQVGNPGSYIIIGEQKPPRSVW